MPNHCFNEVIFRNVDAATQASITFKIGFEHNWMSEGRDRTMRGIWNYAALDDMQGDPWNEIEADEDTHRRIREALWGPEDDDDDSAA